MKTCTYCKATHNEVTCPICRRREHDDSGRHQQTEVKLIPIATQPATKQRIAIINVINSNTHKMETFERPIIQETTSGFVCSCKPVGEHTPATEWFPFHSKNGTARELV